MKEIKKLVSLFEKFWFSNTLMGMSIIFPSGMWIVMVLVIGMSIIEPNNPHYVVMASLFALSALITVLFGWKRV